MPGRIQNMKINVRISYGFTSYLSYILPKKVQTVLDYAISMLKFCPYVFILKSRTYFVKGTKSCSNQCSPKIEKLNPFPIHVCFSKTKSCLILSMFSQNSKCQWLGGTTHSYHHHIFLMDITPEYITYHHITSLSQTNTVSFTK